MSSNDRSEKKNKLISKCLKDLEDMELKLLDIIEKLYDIEDDVTYLDMLCDNRCKLLELTDDIIEWYKDSNIIPSNT